MFLVGPAPARGRRLALRGDLGARPRRREGRVRAPRRPAHGAPRRVPRHARLPLQRGRDLRGQAADGPARDARGRGRRSPAPRGLRRPADGHQAGAARRRAQLLAQADRAARRLRARRRHGLGSDAVLGYERWRDSEDQAELDAIAAYNEEDCLATLALRDWLLAVRPAGITGPAPIASAVPDEEDAEAASERGSCSGKSSPRASRTGSPRWLAGELLEYHRREDRPVWWRYFALREMDERRAHRRQRDARRTRARRRAARRTARSHEYDLRFPPQEHKIEPGTWIDPATGKGVNVCSVDDAARRGRRSGAQRSRSSEPLPRALIRGGPLDTTRAARALQRLAVAVRDGSDRASARCGTCSRTSRRASPAVARGAPIQTTDLERAARARAHARREHARRPGAARHRQDLARRAPDRRSHRARQARRRHGDEPQGDQQPARRGRARRRRGRRRLPRARARSAPAAERRARRRSDRERRRHGRVLRSRVRARRRHDVAVRARDRRRAARLPRDRRGRAALARRLRSPRAPPPAT